MPELKTDARLLERLERAAKTPTSPAQIEKQRISFIMGSISEKSLVTRHEVTKILAAQNGSDGR